MYLYPKLVRYSCTSCLYEKDAQNWIDCKYHTQNWYIIELYEKDTQNWYVIKDRDTGSPGGPWPPQKFSVVTAVNVYIVVILLFHNIFHKYRKSFGGIYEPTSYASHGRFT